MSIIRLGSNQKYSSGWESAFGKEPAKKSDTSAKKTAKSAKKKSAKAAVKKTAKKKK
ncbi:hypothetical protein [Blastopirellula marina]|uniref:Uncharacterized protein n=1 Tax=Blastopirellula marina DSM 3645 TaxID=314230 RepID=A3ZQ58_9BACT|nr:hypothetical protein [Blastopirellula marina]EAQ81331.1 hypothetical protein DSM3645_23106 [Blastopirellula marina DSM 3645]